MGFAATTTRPTAAVPTAILTAFAPLTEAPPELAVIVAVPLALPALNVTTARPLTSVSISVGSIVPSDVVKITCVPVCGGVPPASIIWAISCVAPLTGRAVRGRRERDGGAGGGQQRHLVAGDNNKGTRREGGDYNAMGQACYHEDV